MDSIRVPLFLPGVKLTGANPSECYPIAFCNYNFLTDKAAGYLPMQCLPSVHLKFKNPIFGVHVFFRTMKKTTPMLILVFGLPGTGKSTLAAGLAGRLDAAHFNTDIVRGQLGKRGQYREADKEVIYDELLRLAAGGLKVGNHVIVDGTFYKSSLRFPFMQLAGNHGAVVKWIHVCASEEVVKKRVSKKRKYSEADYAVYLKIASEFEPPEDSCLKVYSDRESPEEMLDKSLEYIKQ